MAIQVDPRGEFSLNDDCDTGREFSASFDRLESATNRVSFFV
jgi:hypothetical protein